MRAADRPPRYCGDVGAELTNNKNERLVHRGALLPVTARLSQKFYERFGDDIAGEFVDWFNAVDSTYQQQLRDLNDLNWERFKSDMDARFARFDAKLSEMKADMMKWMFIYWSGSVLALGALIMVLVRR